jgi:aminomethyltransferase
MTAELLRHTPLTSLHTNLEAKLVPFAGYLMPLNYPGGIIKEHLHTRAHAGLFDVSHMGQITLQGDQVGDALERLVGADVLALPAGRQRYAVLTNDQGGIIDDIMVSRVSQDSLRIVVNAACKNDDYAYIRDAIGASCDVTLHPNLALLALQGPASEVALSALADNDRDKVTAMRFMDVRAISLAGVDCVVSRSGYSGEDGFEISLPAADCEHLAKQLLAVDPVKPIGLGARDSLRLEAGLCLYGHDINEATSPIEAGLAWSIGKARRSGGARSGGFPGAELILQQLDHGVERRRVGLRPSGKVAAREGAAITNSEGDELGKVTSGGFAPSLNSPIAMGYVSQAALARDDALFANVRNKLIALTRADMPFVKPSYVR